MPDQSFPKHSRLQSRSDFRRVYQRRCSVGDNFVRLIGCSNELDYPRIGLSVSRQVGHAVARNRWKRLLREAFRLSKEKMPIGLDFIVVPRNEAQPELKQLAKSLIDLTWRLSKRLKREASIARNNLGTEKNEKDRAKSQRRKDE